MQKERQQEVLIGDVGRFVSWAVATGIAFSACAAVASDLPFKPDRDDFFHACKYVTTYEPGSPYPVRKGLTRLHPHKKQQLSALLDAWDKARDSDKRRLAFILATVRRETSGTFESIREAPGCGDDEFCREREIGKVLEKRRKPGKAPKANYALPVDGRRYYGRGFIQLTGYDNYGLIQRKMGVGLVADPDKALEPKLAGEILIKAMLGGWLGRSKPLSTYINSDGADYVAARSNVNPGSPEAHKLVVAAYAEEFDRCLRPAQ